MRYLQNRNPSVIIALVLLLTLSLLPSRVALAVVTVIETDGSTDLDESTPAVTDSYQLTFNPLPSQTVTITITTLQTPPAPAQCTVTPDTITIPAGTASVDFTVTIVADTIAENSPHPCDIRHNLVSADTNYDGQLVDLTANITDDDAAGITITESGGTTTAVEGSTDTYTINLTSIPAADVNISITAAPASQCSLTGSSTVTIPAYSNPSSIDIQVEANDDSIAEIPPQTCVLSHTINTTAPKYDNPAITVPDVTLQITDNDTAGVNVTPTTVDVTEGASTSLYDIVLTSEPVANVVITVSPDPQCAVSAPTLTFTSSDWDQPQSIIVTPVNDNFSEGNHTCTIDHTSASGDSSYNNAIIASVTANITDDDIPGLSFVESAGVTTVNEEGATSDTYTVALASQPTNDVSITVAPDAQCTVSPNTLNFTSASWNIAQSVTVTAVDDTDSESLTHPCIITHTAASSDPDYNFLTVPLTAFVTDNENPGVVIVESSGTTEVPESTPAITDTYTIQLATAPTAAVTVNIAPDAAQCSTSAASAIFTTLNWNTAQTITVSAVDDLLDEPTPHTCAIAHSITTTDPVYGALSVSNVDVNISDNDGAITVAPTAVNVEEGGASASVIFSLSSAPSTSVFIPVTLTPVGECTISVSGVTVSQIVLDNTNFGGLTAVIDAIDDSADEGVHSCTIITGAAVSTDTDFSGKNPADISVTIADNDGLIDVNAASLNLNENGPTATTMVFTLSTAPAADVSFSLSTPDGQCIVSQLSVLLTTSNWNTGVSVTVTAVDDVISEGSHTCLVTTGPATSADFNYSAKNPPDVTFDIADNDGAVNVIPATANVTEGASLSVTLTLNTTPSASVTVNLSPDSQCSVSAPTVILDSTNWNTGVAVTVTAIDDSTAEGTHACVVTTSAATSADPNFNGENPVDINFTINDNDGAVNVVPTTVNVTEGGATATVLFTLASAPTSGVTFVVSGDAQCTASPNTVTLDSTNWSTGVTVTITAVDDAFVEGTQTCSIITQPTSSADNAYNGLDPADITGTVTDNDAILVNPTAINLTEGGATATVTFTVPSAPASDVTIPLTFSPANQCELVPPATSVIIAASTTSTQITVQAVDDSTAEGTHPCTITTGASTSADPAYNNLDPADITATITDNDSASVTVTPAMPLALAEGGASVDVSFVLTAAPSADVTINFTPDLDCTVVLGLLTFTSSNFSTPQSVTVTAVDDGDIEGGHPCTVITSITTTDPVYQGVNPTDITANIADNDAGPAIEVVPPAVTVTEGGAAAVTFRLTTQPTGDVAFTLTPSSSQCSLPSTQLSVVLTASNWNTGVIRTITATEDTAIEGTHACSIITGTAFSSDAAYNGRNPQDIAVTINDNDGALATSTPILIPTPFLTATPAPTFTPLPSPTPPPAGSVQEVKGLAVRTGPYLGATLIAVARPGTTYPVLARSNDEGGPYTWYLITVGRKTGWVSGRFFKYTGDPNGVPVMGSIFDQIDNPPNIGARANMGAFTDLRRRPSPRSQILRQFPPDTVVEVTGRTVQEGGNYWFQVRIDGLIGWVNGSFVRLIEGNIEDVPVR